jgi:hypothetical protein
MSKNAKTKITCSSIEIPKFRYVDDVTRYLESLRQVISESESVVDAQQKSLAPLTKRETLNLNMDDSPDIETKRTVIPSLDKLKNQYGLSEDLYGLHRTLEAVESQLAIQFPDRGGDAYAAATGALKELKRKVETQMRKVFVFLGKIADKMIPTEFNKYRMTVLQSVENELVFDSVDQFVYVSVDADRNLVFTDYLRLDGALNAAQQSTPHLYLSLQWVIGDGVYVQINHEFEIPTALTRDPALRAQSAGQAVQIISESLALEGFSARAIARLTS